MPAGNGSWVAGSRAAPRRVVAGLGDTIGLQMNKFLVFSAAPSPVLAFL
jgi:hypothetical protein